MIAHTITVALFSILAACGKMSMKTCPESVNKLKINQLQAIASHNSYRKNLPPDIAALLANPPVALPKNFKPAEWDYGHLPLDEQLSNHGIRGIELDVYNDPQGGLFYNRAGNGYVGRSPESGEEKLRLPGLKTLHYPDLDYESHYLTFQDALLALRKWSDAHPAHLPITVIVEPKEDNPATAMPGMGLTATIPFDRAALAGIDVEIKKVFGEALPKVITPDEVRGHFATLNEAVMAGNFPKLLGSRGKIMFIMLATGTELSDYLEGHPSLQGRAMFAFSKPGNPEAAFLNFNDALKDEQTIQQRVREGYFVRTRADVDTQEARTGDRRRMEAAFRSGAEIISTDYYRPDGREGWSDFQVRFPKGELAVVNPVSGNRLECAVEE